MQVAAALIITLDIVAAIGLAIMLNYSNEYERAIFSISIAGFLLSGLIGCTGLAVRIMAPS
jgi:hypothetical protein